eukprot:265964_1
MNNNQQKFRVLSKCLSQESIMYFIQNQRKYYDIAYASIDKDSKWIMELNNPIDTINRTTFNISMTKRDTDILSLSSQFRGYSQHNNTQNQASEYLAGVHSTIRKIWNILPEDVILCNVKSKKKC